MVVMKRPDGSGDPSRAVFGGGARDLTPTEIEQLSDALIEVGQRVRAGKGNEVEIRTVEEVGRILQIDLASASGWSPSLVLCVLLTQPLGARAVAALWSEAGLGSGKK